MLVAVLAVQIVVLIAVVVLLVRKQQPAQTVDARLEALLAHDLPAQLARVDGRASALDEHVRSELASQRREALEASTALRAEVAGSIERLAKTLSDGLDGFRGDNKADAKNLREAVDGQLAALQQRLAGFTADTTRHHSESREALHTRLNELAAAQVADSQKLRDAMQQRLDKLNQDNAAKLEEMRATVDEKLQKTLHTRLTESFGAVTDQLTKVHAGLGEMSKLSAGVDDLSRIFTNVKTRGTVGEVMLENLLKQMLAPNQYEANARVKPNTQEMVEFAVKLPTPHGETLLPIDSKFPREIWERLQTAYENGGDDVQGAGKAFEAAIRFEGRKICEKYIAPPNTTSFAIMFLPSEALYAEVMRRDGLQSDIQQNCRVTIAGPSTLAAILSSFQMGFHMLQLQQKGDEVWKVLANARTQFGKFEDLMTKMDDQVSKVQKTIQDVGTRTRAINRTLRDVAVTDSLSAPAAEESNLVSFAERLPLLAANEDD